MKKLIALLICISLVFCQTIPAYADGKKRSIKDMIEDAADAIGEAGDSISDKAADAGKTIKDKASEAGKEIGNKASEAGKAISDGAKVTGNAISEGADKAGKAAKEGTETAGKAISSGAKAAGNAISEGAEKAGQAAKEGAEAAGKAAASGAKKAKEIAEEGVEKAENVVNDAKERISELSLPDFKSGFEKAASFFGTTAASLAGSVYVDQVATQINKLENDITVRVQGADFSTTKGFVAEEWHAGTFNIDALARGSKKVAKTDKSTGLGSVDVSVEDEIKASSKYYATAEDTAKQQAKNYSQRYHEYAAKSKNPMSMDEWLEKNKIDIKSDSPELYKSIYEGQLRIVPSDQIDGVKKALKKAYAKESVKDGVNRKYLADTDLETMNNIIDKLEASDGTKSIPLTKKESEEIAKAASKGELDLSGFGVKTESMISAKYIAKQSIKSGATAAAIESVLVIGPEIFEMIKYLIETGEIDESQLKKTGLRGLSASADGFLKGSVSNALVVSCKAGKLGASYKNASPELIGTLTVFIIDAITNGIMLANGSITTTEYIDSMAEELVVSMGSLGAATAVAALFPSATLAIMAGSFIGGLIISGGYTVGKQYAIALVENSDIDLMLPITASSQTINGATATAEKKVQEITSKLKNFSNKTKEDITIKVYDLTSTVSLG